MIMTLLGENLSNILKKLGKVSSVSTQTRVGINVLFGIKQIHDIGFVHRDLKPANIAIGRVDTNEYRFLHILDFGLAREFVIVESDGTRRMRRPRARALFRGTTRYCSINTHERGEQGRVDDLWSLLYMLAEMRGPLPWANIRDKKDVLEIKRKTDDEALLENSPVELIKFAQHVNTLTYYTRPDYSLLHSLLVQIMDAGGFKFTDPYDWETKRKHKDSCNEKNTRVSSNWMNYVADRENTTVTQTLEALNPIAESSKLPENVQAGIFKKATDNENPFPAESFATNFLGF